MRWIAIAIVSVIALVVAAFYVLIARHDGDPLDRFEVLSSAPDPYGRLHAVIAVYHHANSSSRWQALWLTTKPRRVGSTERLRGDPVAVWSGVSAEPLWSDRLHLKLMGRADVRTPAASCYFEDVRPMVCFSAGQVAVIAEQ